MKRLMVVLIATAAVCAGVGWDSFKVTYGRPGYYDMPWTIGEATARREWLKIDEDDEVNVDVYAQPEDARVMLLFDKNGNIAGMRMAFLVEDILKKAEEGGHTFDFDYENNPFYSKGRFYGKDLYYSTSLFQNPATLAAGGRAPLDKTSDPVIEGVFYKNNGIWHEVAKDECNIDSNKFGQGNCFAGMGSHYFLKNINEEDCSRRKLFFPLYDQGRLIGFVFSAFGDFTKNPNTKSYYESFPLGALRLIFPNAPTCLEDYIRNYGLINMHVWFTNDGEKITCPTPRWTTRCNTTVIEVKKKKCNLKKLKNLNV